MLPYEYVDKQNKQRKLNDYEKKLAKNYTKKKADNKKIYKFHNFFIIHT